MQDDGDIGRVLVRRVCASSARRRGKAIRYAVTRRAALTRFCDDGRLEPDNNRAENCLRGIALGRRNWTFAGSDKGGERAAAIYTLIETAKLNGVDPEAWLRDVLTRVADRHPVKGKLPGRRPLYPEKAKAALKLVESGMSPTEAARQLGLGRATVYREMAVVGLRRTA